jgi:predicted enzyme related to lactoylglutathione lyase
MEDGGERYADYRLLGEGGSPVAGVRHARGVHAGLPSVWMICLPVGDLAQSLRRVPEEGGKVIRATRDESGAYVDAAVQDPVGATLVLKSAQRLARARGEQPEP